MKHTGGMIDWDGALLADEALVELKIEWEEQPAAKAAWTPREAATPAWDVSCRSRRRRSCTRGRSAARSG
ncbi:MAG TPA: hypothetical protein VNO30_40710 [Kofleriaceae bacterium]|nr:hypothetical protein [Kofleriaceae bacterium]